MTHYYEANDDKGDLVDLIPFCSDPCHIDYCQANGLEYAGWNGCHGDSDVNEFCASCGVIAHVGPADDSCECQRDNVVVNRFLSESGEQCKHGNWIQLPSGTYSPAR